MDMTFFIGMYMWTMPDLEDSFERFIVVPLLFLVLGKSITHLNYLGASIMLHWIDKTHLHLQSYKFTRPSHLSRLSLEQGEQGTQSLVNKKEEQTYKAQTSSDLHWISLSTLTNRRKMNSKCIKIVLRFALSIALANW